MSIEIHWEKFRTPEQSELCTLFQAAAYDTWERIHFSRRTPGLKIHETTITQNLVYELNLLKWHWDLQGFEIFESINESTNGDDLEIDIQQQQMRYKYVVQCKILYHSFRRNTRASLHDGMYRQFPHTVGSDNQIDLLLQHAKDVKAIPLYMLYNFVTTHLPTRGLCGICFDMSQYGCSLVGAHFLKETFADDTGNIPGNITFSQLHPGIALPWLVLACCLPGYTLADTLELFKIHPRYKVNDLSTKATKQNGEWVPLTRYAPLQNEYSGYKEPISGFSARYRFVIDLDKSGDGERKKSTPGG